MQKYHFCGALPLYLRLMPRTKQPFTADPGAICKSSSSSKSKFCLLGIDELNSCIGSQIWSAKNLPQPLHTAELLLRFRVKFRLL